LTKVVNLYKEPYDVYIGRPGKGQDGYFGNPFRVGVDGPSEVVLGLYRQYLELRTKEEPEFLRRILELRGKTLGCFCKPKPCHGDVILEFLERYPG
jgi:hypothetical protein